jgi:hypothetical protein
MFRSGGFVVHRKRLLFTLAAVLASISAVPVALAVSSDPAPRAQVTAEGLTALGSGFTYQGRLTDGGSPGNGNYDIRFILYDSESGGAQVGATITKTNVAVVNGLFSTDLDFGTISVTPTSVAATPSPSTSPTITAVATVIVNAFDGNARWMEIAIRAGGTNGTFTVLSPRQPVSPVPYALYAKAAGGFAVPLTASGSTAGSAGALDITQAGTGIAVAGRRTTTDPSAFPGVYGSNAGGGAGVQGESTFANGVGVQGFATGTDGEGGHFQGPTAIDLDGAIKVSGTKAAFQVVASAGNTLNGFVLIDNPLTNENPTAILIVTPVGTDGTTAVPAVAVLYNTSAGTAAQQDRWAIQNVDGTTAIPANTKFNVLVIQQ